MPDTENSPKDGAEAVDLRDLFKDDVGHLSALKQKVFQLSTSSQSPSVHNAARLFIDQLDLAYLCLNNFNGVLAMVSEASLNEAAEAALARGNFKVLGKDV